MKSVRDHRKTKRKEKTIITNESFGSPASISSKSSSHSSPLFSRALEQRSQNSPLDSSYCFPLSTVSDSHHQLVAATTASVGSRDVASGTLTCELATRRQTAPPDTMEVAAIYEQPMAKVAPQLADQSVARMTTFKVPTGISITSQGCRSNERNSLESIQSRLSSYSTTNELDELDEARHHIHGRLEQTASVNSVKVATRYVSPPQIPPPSIGCGAIPKEIVANQQQQPSSISWQSIRLDDDGDRNEGNITSKRKNRQIKLWPCQKERGLSSILLAKLKRQSTVSDKLQKYQSDAITAKQRNSSPLLAHNDIHLSVDASGGKHAKSLDSNSTSGGKLSFLSEAGQQTHKSSDVSGDGNQNRDQLHLQQQIGKRKAPFMFAGILASILGSVFFSMGTLTIKLLPDGQGLGEKTQIACWRGFIMMILCSLGIIKSKCGFLVPRDEIVINVLRSVFGFMGIYMSYMSLKYISMGDATALVFSSPVWTSLLSHYILHEPLRWIQLLALPMSLVGIILIAHPSLLVNIEYRAGSLEKQPLLDVSKLQDPLTVSMENGASANASNYSAWLQQQISANGTVELNQDIDNAMNVTEHFDYEHRWKGVVIALATSLVVSFVYIVLKFRKATHIQTATFWLAFTTFVGSLFMGLFVGMGEFPTKWTELALLVFNGFCSWLGQCLLQWALAYEDASILSVVRTLDVAISFSLSAIFLDEEILWTSILGASIIAGVVISIILSSYIQNKLCPPRVVVVDNDDDDQLRSPSATRLSISSAESNGLDMIRANPMQYKEVVYQLPGNKPCGYPKTLFDLTSTKTATIGA